MHCGVPEKGGRHHFSGASARGLPIPVHSRKAGARAPPSSAEMQIPTGASGGSVAADAVRAWD
jgi:hypothetical protein